MKLYVSKGQYGWQTRAVNGEEKMYIDIGFKKGQEPQEQFCQIEIKDAFFSFYKTKTGLGKPKLIILDYELLSKLEDKQEDMGVFADTTLPF